MLGWTPPADTNRAAGALAGTLARIVWAVWKHERSSMAAARSSSRSRPEIAERLLIPGLPPFGHRGFYAADLLSAIVNSTNPPRDSCCCCTTSRPAGHKHRSW
jgi:hypothetical protein